MKVLIIRNLGYVGPVLVSYFKEKNRNVKIFGFDIGYFLGNELSHNYLLPEVYLEKQYFGDVRKFPFEILNGMDGVVYLAAISNDPMSKEFEGPTYEINQNSAHRIAVEARARGVKHFVFASSCSVYGSADDLPRKEDAELQPLTAYAKSKVNAEKDLEPLSTDEFIITCLRFATACGYSPRLRLDLVLNDFVVGAYLNKKIDILSNGLPWRPLIHVKDMSRAIYWALTRTTNEGGNFLVCNTGSNEWNFQIIELAEKIKSYIPETTINVNANAPADKRSYKVDFSLFKKLAGDFYPKMTLDETILDLLENLKRYGFNRNDFRNSEFIRLNTLKKLIEIKQINHELEII